jgi:hypothetical protein
MQILKPAEGLDMDGGAALMRRIQCQENTHRNNLSNLPNTRREQDRRMEER